MRLGLGGISVAFFVRRKVEVCKFCKSGNALQLPRAAPTKDDIVED